MKIIEKKMTQAIAEYKHFRSANTEIRQIIDNKGNALANIYLYGNHIGTYNYANNNLVVNEITLAQYPTNTTKSRLRAFGVNVTTAKGLTYLNGVAL